MNDLSLLVGKTLESVSDEDDEMLFVCSDGSAFKAYHYQECCESVGIYDIKGDLQSLIGSPILEAVEDFGDEWESDVPTPDYLDSFTWTIHTFRTELGTVVVRWLGESNGYYGESPYFMRTHEPITVDYKNEDLE